MERYETAQDVLDEVWNDSGEEPFCDNDNDFSDFEENSGPNENDENINSHDSEGVGTGVLNGVGSEGVKL